MLLTPSELDTENRNASLSGRTSPAYSATKGTHSDAFWERLPAKAANFNHQGENGRTLVVCLDPKEQSRGGSSMPNISDWPNDAAVCSLSQVLEEGLIPQKYFLSAKACAGILRRAEKRGKTLPEPLMRALTAAASQEQTKPVAGMCSQSPHMGGGRTSGPVEVAACLVAKGQKCDFEVETFCVHGTQDPDICIDHTHPLGRNNGAKNVVLSVALRGREGGATAELGDDVAGCLRASGGGGDKPHVLTHCRDVAGAITSNYGKQVDSSDTALGPNVVTYAIQAGALRANPNSGPDGVGVQGDHAYTLEARSEVQAVCVTGEVTHTLKADGFDGSEDGTGRGQPIVAAFAENSRAELRYEAGDGSVTGAISTGGGKPGQGTPSVQVGSAVRRLTPVECERLQGFPDDYTQAPYRNKPAADGPRYKAIGNSWAVPCARWVGVRVKNQLLGMPNA